MRWNHDDLEPITFGHSLLCGMADCGSQTTFGLLERDERLPGLWQLLPLCPDCLDGLRAGGRRGEGHAADRSLRQ